MFDGGVPEQIHQFIASPQPPPPLPPHQPATERSLPFPVSFASLNSNHQSQHMLSLHSPKIIHHHHHHGIKDGGVTSDQWIGHTDHDGDNHRHYHHIPWCSDEVLALLRFRSTVENWLPEFTWELTSRKLAEVGFKRSPQECKEKFEEEERRYFNSNNNANDHHHISNYNNKGNYRMFSEVEELYHHVHNDGEHVSSEVGDNQNKRNNSLEGKEKVEEMGQSLLGEGKRDHQGQGQVEESSMGNKINPVDNVRNIEDGAKSSSSSLMMIMREKKKRKKKKERFGVLKGFCEDLVRNMVAQQEDMHNKLLEDMMKNEEEKMAREEAWKKQEMERFNKEVEIRAKEQAMVSDRNSSIIKFISKFTDHDDGNYKVHSPSPSQDLSYLALPKTQGRRKCQTSSSLLPQTLTPHNPISLQTNDIPLEPISTKTLKTKTQNIKPPENDEKSDIGKRWPRDEVLALINIRRSISIMNDDGHHHKDGISLSSSSSKAVPLWERISKKMMESGYKRSAKRCKEKWENINKYFKKTKDGNKKRPLDSRTCPYFHQLTALYSQPSSGTTTTTVTDTSTGGMETRPEENRIGSRDLDDVHAAMHVDADGAGEKSNVEFSGFDLEFE